MKEAKQAEQRGYSHGGERGREDPLDPSPARGSGHVGGQRTRPHTHRALAMGGAGRGTPGRTRQAGPRGPWPPGTAPLPAPPGCPGHLPWGRTLGLTVLGTSLLADRVQLGLRPQHVSRWGGLLHTHPRPRHSRMWVRTGCHAEHTVHTAICSWYLLSALAGPRRGRVTGPGHESAQAAAGGPPRVNRRVGCFNHFKSYCCGINYTHRVCGHHHYFQDLFITPNRPCAH